jgi:hypothetical protein
MASSAQPSPTGPGVPGNVTFTRRDDATISFDMPATNVTGKDIFYPYALHMDQTGSDGVKVDIGIDPQIINHPSGREPPTQ